MPRVLFWDIDGTLLLTGSAGLMALEGAARSLFGAAPDFSRIQTAGSTDREIAAAIIRQLGHVPTAEEISAFVHAYERLLPECLPKKTGRVMPKVREILDHVSKDPDFVCLLLTGNTAAGARAKLSYYGLDGYFAGGAFADGCSDRTAIARRAAAMAGEFCPRIKAGNMFVIGDTPNDIACGKAIGARTIAVATGLHALDELIRHDPWWAVEKLPAPADFVAKLQREDCSG